MIREETLDKGAGTWDRYSFFFPQDEESQSMFIKGVGGVRNQLT